MDPSVPLVECQFYDRGLASQIVGVRSRPAWLPNTEVTGLRHGEPELRKGEYAIEFSRFDNAGKHLTWIGLFTAAEDRIHGDRGNHCGVGVWLSDSLARYPTLLLHSLRQLCDALANDGKTAELDAQLERFSTTKFLGTYIASTDVLPRALAGMPYHSGPFPKTLFFGVDPGDDLAAAMKRVGWAILQASIAAGMENSASRRLFLLISREQRQGLPAELPPIPAEYESIGNIIDSLGIAFADGRQLGQELEQTQKQYRLETQRTSQEATQLRDQLRSTEGNLQSLDTQLRVAKSQNKSLDAQARALDEQLKALQEQNRALQEQIRTLREERSQLPQPSYPARAAREETGKSNDSLLTKITSISDDVRKLQNKLFPPEPAQPSKKGLALDKLPLLPSVALLSLFATLLIGGILVWLRLDIARLGEGLTEISTSLSQLHQDEELLQERFRALERAKTLAQANSPASTTTDPVDGLHSEPSTSDTSSKHPPKSRSAAKSASTKPR